MNIIMIAGQIIIIFKGGQAFQIHPLNGKEWGLSIGLGAISLPWGALIRLFPDAWAAALVPKVKIKMPWSKEKKDKAAGEEDVEASPEKAASLSSSSEEFSPPPRSKTHSMIRGRRGTEPISERSRGGIRAASKRAYYRAVHNTS